MESRCSTCGRKIPKARLAILPNTTRCVRCSAERPKTDRDVEIDQSDAGDFRGSVSGGEKR